MKIVNAFMFDGLQSMGTKLISDWSIEYGMTPRSFPGSARKSHESSKNCYPMKRDVFHNNLFSF